MVNVTSECSVRSHTRLQRPYMALFTQQWITEVRPLMVANIMVLHLLAIIGILRMPDAQWESLILAFGLYFWGAVSITAGSHRLWAHRSYKASFPVRLFLVFSTSLANQGTIYHWVRDHRIHHKYSDTDADPHNVNRGFFFSHIGWLLMKKHPKVIEAGKGIPMDDLKRDSLVMWQHRAGPVFNSALCFGLPTVLAHVAWGEDWSTALLICGFLRYVVLLHATFFVNSAAHYFGDRPYDPNIRPCENWFVSLVAAGEGWHNWHHKYPFDYAASEFGVSGQFNPTKLIIDTWARLGLVSDRKRATSQQKPLKSSGFATGATAHG